MGVPFDGTAVTRLALTEMLQATAMGPLATVDCRAWVCAGGGEAVSGQGDPDPWGSDSDADRTGMSPELLEALAAHPYDMIELVESLSPRVSDWRSLLQLMWQVSAQAVRLLKDVHWAGVTAQFDSAPFTCAHTHDRVLMLDEEQYRGGDGPCLRALRTNHPVRMTTRELHAAWPALGTAAQAAGVRAVIAVPLRAAGVPAAALNLYCGAEPHLQVLDTAVLTVLVQYLQRGLMDYARANPQDATTLYVRQALHAHSVIGQAQGIIMVRDAVGATEALTILERQARSRQLPTWRYAEEIVRSLHN